MVPPSPHKGPGGATTPHHAGRWNKENAVSGVTPGAKSYATPGAKSNVESVAEVRRARWKRPKRAPALPTSAHGPPGTSPPSRRAASRH